jgi:hypothetical protein
MMGAFVKILLRIVTLGLAGKSMAGSAVLVVREAHDVVTAVAALAQDAADNGMVHEATKRKAQSELSQFTMRTGAFIDSFPEEDPVPAPAKKTKKKGKSV